MRLINTITLELRDFSSTQEYQRPLYSILSHTWGQEEVLFADLQPSADRVATEKKTGWAKITDFCRISRIHGIQWGWVDTCCIDKTSSSELSEAINSMFRWYQGSFVCYAYLCDFDRSSAHDLGSTVPVPRWFTRGWTLQELVAPRNVVFYNSKWDDIGTKLALRKCLERITGIDAAHLAGDRVLSSYSVAQRMSWASKRNTTRIEDEAYSLLGIFNIFMPLLYGEGGRAFSRLQEEIIKAGGDDSLFAWTATPIQLVSVSGILSPSPRYYANSAHLVAPSGSTIHHSTLVAITNRGLETRLAVHPADKNNMLAELNCYSVHRPQHKVAIYLAPTDADKSERQAGVPLLCCRIHHTKLEYVEERPSKTYANLLIRPVWTDHGRLRGIIRGPRIISPVTSFGAYECTLIEQRAFQPGPAAGCFLYRLEEGLHFCVKVGGVPQMGVRIRAGALRELTKWVEITPRDKLEDSFVDDASLTLRSNPPLTVTARCRRALDCSGHSPELILHISLND